MRHVKIGGANRAAQALFKTGTIVAGKFAGHQRGGFGIVAQAQDGRARCAAGTGGATGNGFGGPAKAMCCAVFLHGFQPGGAGELIQTARARCVRLRLGIKARFHPRLRHQIGKIDAGTGGGRANGTNNARGAGKAVKQRRCHGNVSPHSAISRPSGRRGHRSAVRACRRSPAPWPAAFRPSPAWHGRAASLRR